MGSNYNPSKHPYDITMSKRTRRPLKVQDANRDSTDESIRNDTPWKAVEDGEDESSPSRVDEAEESDRKPSLKQLIKGRSSLGKHFTEEEKQLQLVTKQQEEGFQGLKLKRMVTRCAKVLRHMIKVKRELPKGESRKKPFLLLKV